MKGNETFRKLRMMLSIPVLALLMMLSMSIPARAATSGFYEYSVSTSSGGAVIKKYTGDEINCVIPSKLGGQKVVKIDSSAFKGMKYMTTVKIPSTVTELGSWAFQNCTALTSVTVPDSVTSMRGTFAGCTSLKTVVIGKGVKNLDSAVNDGMFENCTSLVSVFLPEGLEIIGSDAFRNCTSLQSVRIPNTVTTIRYEAFNGCNSLTEIVIPDSVTTLHCNGWLSEATVGNCASLKRIVVGKNVTHIPTGCFRGNPSLTSIEFRGDKISYIGSFAFAEDTSLTSITIPANVELLADRAFQKCTALTSVRLNEGLGEIQRWCFEGCSALKSITIPGSVCLIGERIFNGCSQLSSVTFNPCFNASQYESNIVGYYGGTGLVVSCYSTSQFKDKLISDSKSKTHPFTVLERPGITSQKITMSKKQVNLYTTQKEKVTYTLTPANSTDSVHWVSSDTKIAEVNQGGWIKAVGTGSAVITAETNSGAVAQINVICQKAPEKLEVTTTKKTLAMKQTMTLKAKVDGGSRTDVLVSFKSSNSAVASVNSQGKITAKKAGTAVITASTFNGLTATCKVTVKKAPSKITLKKTLTLKKGKSATLKYTITKGSYTSKVTWKSSNKKVVTVNSKGKVTAKKKGTCKITATTHNNKKATCKVTVK